MGINIGAFICNFFGAYLRNEFSWGHAFMAAGIGMFVGVIIFWLGEKHYKHADVRKPVNPEDMSLSKVFGIVLLPAIITGYLGWIIPENILSKAPSAELRPGQKDSDSLPPYDILDKILFEYIELRKGPKEIIKGGYDETLVNRILSMVNRNEYKRKQLSPVLRISSKAFGLGRRMPIVGKYLS